MDVNKLMAGVAVIIDDEVNEPSANINQIVSQIKVNHFPFLTYDYPPSKHVIQNLKDVSFIVLDWQFGAGISEEDTMGGTSQPQHVKEGDIVVDFLKELNEVCFVPVFIFSNAAKKDIIKRLSQEKLYSKHIKHNHIFISSKSDVQEDLFNKIEAWLKHTPSIYALKEWDRAFDKARRDLFWNFYEINPDWPKILWATYGDDGVDKSMELGETISKNIHARIEPFEFEDELLNNLTATVPKKDIQAVMEGERFIKRKFLPENMIHTGDLFKKDKKYFLNIRPSCDCIARDGCAIDQVKLYLLRGEKESIGPANRAKIYSDTHGLFIEKESYTYLFPIDGDKLIRFNFDDLILADWVDYKDDRIGKVISPYVIKVQQKYSAYLQRQGLNRIPKASLE